MLLQSFFIIDHDKYEELPDIKLPPNAFLCYRVTIAHSNELDSFNKKLLLSQNKNPYCLLINLDKTDSPVAEIIESAVSFSFHYKYLKFSYDNPLIIVETKIEDASKHIQLVKEIFKSHGYNDIEIITLENTGSPVLVKKNGKNIYFSLQENINSLSSEYINSIKDVTSADSFFFLFLDVPQKLPEVLGIINQTEGIIQKDLPQTYCLLQENMAARNKEQELLFKIGLYQEQIDSQNNYHLYYNLPDSRYKRQLSELISFYKNEYEILPEWYKRLGHIIKVLMRKRTFRSLFNNNVKKYKV